MRTHHNTPEHLADLHNAPEIRKKITDLLAHDHQDLEHSLRILCDCSIMFIVNTVHLCCFFFGTLISLQTFEVVRSGREAETSMDDGTSKRNYCVSPFYIEERAAFTSKMVSRGHVWHLINSHAD